MGSKDLIFDIFDRRRFFNEDSDEKCVANSKRRGGRYFSFQRIQSNAAGAFWRGYGAKIIIPLFIYLLFFGATY